MPARVRPKAFASERPPARERSRQCQLVRELQAAAGGEALGDAGDGGALLAQKAGDVARGGLAFDVGVEREDDLGRLFVGDARG